MSCFTNVLLLAISASYAIDDIGAGVREVISDLNEALGPRHESKHKFHAIDRHVWLSLIDVICDWSLKDAAWNLFVKSGQVGIDRHQAFFVIHSF